MAESVNPSLSLLTQVSRQAALVVLLLHLGYLPSARELEALLGINRRTMAIYLDYLVQLGLIQRGGRNWTYSLVQPVSEAHKRLLRNFIPNADVLSQIWLENMPIFPLITTTDINPDFLRESKAEAVIINKGDNWREMSPVGAKDSPIREKNRVYSSGPPEGCNPELWQALAEAHISGRKRRSLAQQAGLTPEAVRLWEQRLRKDKGGAYTPGLLIYVLERNEELPATNELGHLEDCKCKACKDFKYRDFLIK